MSTKFKKCYCALKIAESSTIYWQLYNSKASSTDEFSCLHYNMGLKNHIQCLLHVDRKLNPYLRGYTLVSVPNDRWITEIQQIHLSPNIITYNFSFSFLGMKNMPSCALCKAPKRTKDTSEIRYIICIWAESDIRWIP